MEQSAERSEAARSYRHGVLLECVADDAGSESTHTFTCQRNGGP